MPPEGGGDKRDWSGLPPELLQIIACKLPLISDHVRFRAVCPSWRSTVRLPATLPPHFPWFLLLKHDSPTSYLYNIIGDRLYSYRTPTTNGNIIGSSLSGYLLIVNHDCISIFNPFTASHIHLPPLPQPFRHGKLIDDSMHGLSVIFHAHVGGISSFFTCHPRESLAWTRVDTPGCVYWRGYDFTYRNGRFFVSRMDGGCEIVDSSSSPVCVTRVNPPADMCYQMKHFLVQCPSGELLMVCCGYLPGQVTVYGLHECQKPGEWVRIRSIGYNVLFIDDVNAVCCATSDFADCLVGGGNHAFCMYSDRVFEVDVGGEYEELELPCGWRGRLEGHYWHKAWAFPGRSV